METLTHQVSVLAVLPGSTLHQGLPAVTSVQQVSMTLTLILRLHARTAQSVSTLQPDLHLALTAQLAMRMMTVMRLQSVWSAVRVDMLERGARRVQLVQLVHTTMISTLPLHA